MKGTQVYPNKGPLNYRKGDSDILFLIACYGKILVIDLRQKCILIRTSHR